MRFQVALGGLAHEALQLGKDLYNGLRSGLSGERKNVEVVTNILEENLDALFNGLLSGAKGDQAEQIL